MHNLTKQNEYKVKIKTDRAAKTSAVTKNIFLLLYLLIPILSVESIVAWGIFAAASYRTIKLYRSQKEAKTKKACIILLISFALALAYNIFVHILTQIVVQKNV